MDTQLTSPPTNNNRDAQYQSLQQQQQLFLTTLAKQNQQNRNTGLSGGLSMDQLIRLQQQPLPEVRPKHYMHTEYQEELDTFRGAVKSPPQQQRV